MREIPEWAFNRVNQLRDAEAANGLVSVALPNAFARYIAQHEEPPVDPLFDPVNDAIAEVQGRAWPSLDVLAVVRKLRERGIELAEGRER